MILTLISFSWALAPPEIGRVFDTHVKYPCNFKLKIIGVEDDTFVSDMVEKIGRVTATTPSDINYTTNPSKNGKFVSITLDAPVASADKLYECYDALRSDARVKFTL